LASARKELAVSEEAPTGHRYSEFSKRRHGFLTEKQSRILYLRSRGFTQLEVAKQLKMSRASVSMIEGRARRQVLRSRQTIQYFELVERQYEISVSPGVRLQQIPMVVLQEADKHGIHLRRNMVEILRIVKKTKADSLGADSRLSEKLLFRFNERGKLTLL
jgi:HTH-type transcriptional regulator, fmd operon transcriptional regulator